MEPIWLAQYPRDVDPRPPLTPGTLAPWIEERLSSFAGREAYRSMGRSLSFGELHELSIALAAHLQAEGLAQGSRVAIMLPNVLAFPVATLAVQLAGLVAVNVNPLYTPRELAHQLNDSGARTLIAWEPALPVIEQALALAPLERVVTMPARWLLDGDAAPPARGNGPWRSFAAALADGARRRLAPVAVEASAPAFLQYTGGTTGVSKGAVLSHRNVLAQQAQLHAWLGPTLARMDAPLRSVTCLPLYHVGALMAALFMNLGHGIASILIADPRNLDAFVATLRNERFTAFGGINTLYNALASHPGIREVDFSACRYSAAGAASTQPAVAERWQALTGNWITEIYGLTETTACVSSQVFDGRPFDGSAGLPLPRTEVSIRDVEGRELEVGATGEICVRGPQVMEGYWQRPDETAKVMTEDGYLRTGDVGRIDERGRLFISDRTKDMILVSGFNVFPNEVEGVLLAHPKVLEAAVVSVPDEHSGEVPIAFVVARDASLSEAELRAHAAASLTAYKRPRRYEFRDALPKSPVGKVLRRALRDEARSTATGG